MTRKIIWVKPLKEKNISIGRKRIADRIEEKGNYKVEVKSGIDLNTLKLLLFGGYDCLIGTTRIGAVAGLIARMRGKKVIIDHVDPIEQFRVTDGKLKGKLVELVENLAFRFSDAVLITNEEDEERVNKRAKKVIKSNLGVEFENFARPSKESIEKAKDILKANGVGVHSNYPLVTYVGGLEEIYNIDKLVLAMKFLKDWELVIIGRGSSESELRDITATEDINNVYFLGSIDPSVIPGILHFSDVCITLCETPRQVKILEYAASGKPVVAPKKVKEKFCQVQATDLAPSEIASNIKKAVEMPKLELVEFQKEIQEHDYKRIAILYESAIKEEEAK